MKAALVLVLGVAVAASAIVASAATSQKTSKPAQVVRASFDALNRGDAAASAAYFASDGELITPLGGCSPCAGRAVIEEHLSAAIANGTKVTVVGWVRAKDETVVVRAEIRASGFPPGVERVMGTFRSTVRKGLIVRQKNVFDRRDPQTATLLAVIEGTSTSSA